MRKKKKVATKNLKIPLTCAGQFFGKWAVTKNKVANVAKTKISDQESAWQVKQRRQWRHVAREITTLMILIQDAN
jgi:hypothetical protein